MAPLTAIPPCHHAAPDSTCVAPAQWVHEMLAASAEAAAAAGEGAAGRRARELDVYSLALFEIGRASGRARCRLLERLWGKAAAAWQADKEELQAAAAAERARHTSRVAQLSKRVAELELLLGDASDRAQAAGAGAGAARRESGFARKQLEAEQAHARAEAAAGRQVQDAVKWRLAATAERLEDMAAEAPGAEAMEFVCHAAAELRVALEVEIQQQARGADAWVGAAPASAPAYAAVAPSAAPAAGKRRSLSWDGAATAPSAAGGAESTAGGSEQLDGPMVELDKVQASLQRNTDSATDSTSSIQHDAAAFETTLRKVEKVRGVAT